MSVVRDFDLINSEVKQRSVVSEEKQRREHSQIFHFNSGESKTA